MQVCTHKKKHKIALTISQSTTDLLLNRKFTLAIVIGIDEAGYGPILGPLVVSAVVADIPDNLLTQSLWDILRSSITKQRSASAGRIIINDSKKLHKSHGNYKLLQRAVLATIKATSTDQNTTPTTLQLPTTLGELLTTVSPDFKGGWNNYPWYKDKLYTHKLTCNQTDIATAAQAMYNDMLRNNIKIKALWSQPLLVGQFNHQVNLTGNKSKVLFSLAAQWMYKAYNTFENNNLQILIDKHGGRTHYRELLQKIFPDLKMKILREESKTSSYSLTQSNREIRVHFLEKGDSRHMLIALASLLSKYLRELFMEVLNDYFRQKCPAIKPTAGYYIDGKRFLAELDTHQIIKNPHHKDLLIRNR